MVKQLNNTLKVAHNSEYDKIRKLKVGEAYQCEIKHPRNLEFHRKFFALITMLFENQDIYTDPERLRKDLIIEAGFYNEWTDFNGIVRKEAKSISFARMEEEEFRELYYRIMNVIVHYFHFNKQEIIDNVEQFL